MILTCNPVIISAMLYEEYLKTRRISTFKTQCVLIDKYVILNQISPPIALNRSTVPRTEQGTNRTIPKTTDLMSISISQL